MASIDQRPEKYWMSELRSLVQRKDPTRLPHALINAPKPLSVIAWLNTSATAKNIAEMPVNALKSNKISKGKRAIFNKESTIVM